MSLKSLFLSLVLVLTPALAVGQTLSQTGCQLIASAAAHAVMEAQGKEPKGSTKQTLEMMFPREGDPGKFYVLVDYLIEKYQKLPKAIPDKVFQVEYARCVKAEGEIEKLLPQRT